MRLRDLVGKRVELMEDESWAGIPKSHGIFIKAGSLGTVEAAKLEHEGQPIIHINFDKVKPREGFYFGVGYADWDFSEARLKRMRVIEETEA